MNKWEYCTLFIPVTSTSVLTIYKSDGAQKFSVKRDATIRGDTDSHAVERLVADLGLDGWELISLFTNAGATVQWAFKRPVSS